MAEHDLLSRSIEGDSNLISLVVREQTLTGIESTKADAT